MFQRLRPLLSNQCAQQALTILERDFAAIDSLGPFRVAEFLGDRDHATVRADAAGTVRITAGHVAEKHVVFVR